MSQPQRIGLMGGTFDPIHNGHLAIADEVRAALNLDTVIFEVAGVPALKYHRAVTSAERRYLMVERAVAHYAPFQASRLEIERGGISYTIDTVDALRARFGARAEIFVIVGTDALEDLARWHEPERLCAAVTFVLCPRPGTDTAGVRDHLSRAGLAPNIVQVDVAQLEISSTDIRRRVAAGEPYRFLVPSAVERYIEENGLYGREVADSGSASPRRATAAARAASESAPAENAPTASVDLGAVDGASLTGEALIAHVTTLLEGRLTELEFTHTMRVGAMSSILAQVYQLDADEALLAGMLHDWDKCAAREELLAKAARYAIPVPAAAQRTPKLLHAYTGAAELAERFPQLSTQVIESIRCHTIGEPHMSELAMAVYVADLIEPAREHGGVDTLREMVGTVSLRTLFFQAFERTMLHLVADRKMVHPDTVAVWNWLVTQPADG